MELDSVYKFCRLGKKIREFVSAQEKARYFCDTFHPVSQKFEMNNDQF
jgi:hypothetical protein